MPASGALPSSSRVKSLRYHRWFLSLTALAAAGPALAHPAYDTRHMLDRANGDCAGVPGCVEVGSQSATVPIAGRLIFAVSCPAGTPNAWHWDTVQHEHVLVVLSGRSPTTLTFVASNLADAPGRVQVFVGCSAQPFTFVGTGFMQSRTGVPTKLIGRHGGKP
jgi:hypothetical protein